MGEQLIVLVMRGSINLLAIDLRVTDTISDMCGPRFVRFTFRSRHIGVAVRCLQGRKSIRFLLARSLAQYMS